MKTNISTQNKLMIKMPKKTKHKNNIEHIKELKILKLVRSSFNSFKNNPLLVFLSIIADFLFLLFFAAFTGIFQILALDHLTKLMQMVGQQTGGLSQIYDQGTLALLSPTTAALGQNAVFQIHVRAIAKYIGLMIIVGYICWCVFQGISWYLAYRASINQKKNIQPFWKFWKNFWLESISFYALTILIIFASVKAMITIKTALAPIVSEGVMNTLFVILALIVWYFGFLAYSLTNKKAYHNFKQSFIYGVKKFPKTILSFGGIIIFIVIIDFILKLIFKISFINSDIYIKMLIGIILLLPTFAFARILLFKTRKEYWELPKQNTKKKK